MLYAGNKNWTQWNVSFWVRADDCLSALATGCMRHTHDRDAAAQMMLGFLREMGMRDTPDGATYSRVAIKAAMDDIAESG